MDITRHMLVADILHRTWLIRTFNLEMRKFIVYSQDSSGIYKSFLVAIAKVDKECWLRFPMLRILDRHRWFKALPALLLARHNRERYWWSMAWIINWWIVTNFSIYSANMAMLYGYVVNRRGEKQVLLRPSVTGEILEKQRRLRNGSNGRLGFGGTFNHLVEQGHLLRTRNAAWLFQASIFEWCETAIRSVRLYSLVQRFHGKSKQSVHQSRIGFEESNLTAIGCIALFQRTIRNLRTRHYEHFRWTLSTKQTNLGQVFPIEK